MKKVLLLSAVFSSLALAQSTEERIRQLEEQIRTLQQEIQRLKEEQKKAEETKQETEALKEELRKLRLEIAVPQLELKTYSGLGPAAFPSAERPFLERRILLSTWEEMGVTTGFTLPTV
ncbi:MAG: FlxA-like family protein [Thermocrinis sp.]|nr:FlxA-like family protein [Thermocrinis sp.]